MKYGVAEAARILQVEKDLIKTWAYKFSDYLSLKANPPKGQSREFTIEDLRVMAYIFTYWEENPDIEYIKIGLNSNSHYENELIDDLLIEAIPIFIDPPENMDETWKHGVLFGGLSQFGDQYFLATSYKLAGDKLINIALKNQEAWELFCPAVYNYRHAIELFMKDVIGYRKQTHDLLILFNKLESMLKTKFNTDIPDWFKNIIIVFNEFDPGGTTFRYGGNLNKDEVFIDFIQLKTLMERLSTSFKNIKQHQSRTIGDCKINCVKG